MYKTYIPRLYPAGGEEPRNEVSMKILFFLYAEFPLCVAVCAEVRSPLEEGSQGQEKREGDSGRPTRGTSWHTGNQERDGHACLDGRIKFMEQPDQASDYGITLSAVPVILFSKVTQLVCY